MSFYYVNNIKANKFYIYLQYNGVKKFLFYTSFYVRLHKNPVSILHMDLRTGVYVFLL